MPTYEYECMECKYRFDVFQSMKDDPIKECKKCGSNVRRLFGPGAGIIFKGSGFYVNDYKKAESHKKTEQKKEEPHKEEKEKKNNDNSSSKIESDLKANNSPVKENCA